MTLAGFEHFVLEILCPSFGVMVACAMFAAPVSTLCDALRETKVRRQKRGTLTRGGSFSGLANLNPLPWVFMLGNCLGWLAYAFVTGNFFVFFANAPGFILSIWLNAGAIKLEYLRAAVESAAMEEAASSIMDAAISPSRSPANVDLYETVLLMSAARTRAHAMAGGSSDSPGSSLPPPPPRPHKCDRWAQFEGITSQQERYMLVIVISWIILCSFVGLSPTLHHDARKGILGVAANVNLVFFFGAPLSTIRTVVLSRCSSSIHRRTLAMNTLNASFWTAYGFAILDPFVAVPNLLGVLLGVTQAILCLLYPVSMGRKSVFPSEDPDGVVASVEKRFREYDRTASSRKIYGDDLESPATEPLRDNLGGHENASQEDEKRRERAQEKARELINKYKSQTRNSGAESSEEVMDIVRRYSTRNINETGAAAAQAQRELASLDLDDEDEDNNYGEEQVGDVVVEQNVDRDVDAVVIDTGRRESSVVNDTGFGGSSVTNDGFGGTSAIKNDGFGEAVTANDGFGDAGAAAAAFGGDDNGFGAVDSNAGFADVGVDNAGFGDAVPSFGTETAKAFGDSSVNDNSTGFVDGGFGNSDAIGNDDTDDMEETTGGENQAAMGLLSREYSSRSSAFHLSGDEDEDDEKAEMRQLRERIGGGFMPQEQNTAEDEDDDDGSLRFGKSGGSDSFSYDMQSII